MSEQASSSTKPRGQGSAAPDGPAAATSARSTSTAVRAGGVGRASPSDVVAALRGSSTVTLSGFGAHFRAPPLLRPGVQFVSASISADGLRDVLDQRRRRLRGLRWAAISASHIAAAAIAALAAVSLAGGKPDSRLAAGADWRVVAVEEGAVRVATDAGAARGRAVSPAESAGMLTVRIPLGARLPNGETLVLTHPQRGVYVTDVSHVSLVRGTDHPMPHKETAR